MSEQHAQGMAQRLQDIREGLNTLFFIHRGDSKSLEAISMAYQMLEELETLAPEEVDTQILSLLEEVIQGGNRSYASISAERRTLHEEGFDYFQKFERGGNLDDLERAIASWQRVVEVTPESHSDLPAHLSNLGSALRTRFEHFGALADLEAALSQTRRAVDLTLDGHPGKPGYLNNLGSALETRFDQYGSPPDLDEATLLRRKAVDLTPNGDPHKPGRLSNLGNALERRFDRHGSLPDLEEAILQKRKAVDLTPDGTPDKPSRLNNLGNALKTRFDRYGSLLDLEEAILQTRKAVDLTPDGHSVKPIRLNNLGNALMTRFDRYGSLPDLEEAILQTRKAVELTPDGTPGKPGRLNNLGKALKTRFDRYGSLPDLQEAILQTRKAVDLTPDGHPSKPICLNNLVNALEKRFDRQDSPQDLEEAILLRHKAVDLTPDGHPEKPGYLNNLGNVLEMRFDRHGSLPDLEEAILQGRMAVALISDGHPDKPTCLNNLSRVLRIRFERFGDQDDLQNALSAAQQSAESSASSSSLRLRSALSWARCCTLGSVSSLPAFECAIKLLPRIAWPGLAVDDQYFLLSESGSAARAAVEAAIAEGEVTTAIEWAEQGRSIVWQNLLNLRTPLDGLQSRYPELATRLREVSQHLEHSVEARNVLDVSNSPGVANNLMAVALERDGLVEKIQSKPGFENFMKPKSLEELAPAARDGPIVFLNLGNTSCDALALLLDDNGAPHVVPISLERVSLESAEQLSNKLVDLLSNANVRSRDIRKHKFHGAIENTNAVFELILRTLWLDYVQPIIERLAYEVNLDSPPRLWWCTTGPLAFLPLHAAGLYDAKEAGHKASDYVVSSYTPTLTALLEESSPATFREPRILAVAISNTPGAPLPCTEEETQTLHRLAANLPVINLTNEEATEKRVLEELETSTWAHLACHGEQVGGKPMESGLILHDGKLKMSEIVKARLPNAEFAFLSACQTAVGDGGVPEESAHLAAGMLFAGYRGVVATMWSIQDDIAPRVAEDFYRYMFRRGRPKREEAAYALHKAVKSLQESEAPFISWVPFIYIGR